MSELKLPKFPDYTELENTDTSGTFWDYQELENINGTMVRTVLNLKEINRRLTEHERQKLILELEYKKKYRQVILSSKARTETMKKQLAELECEDLQWEIAYHEEVIRELSRLSSSLKIDIEVLKTLSFNLRQELKL